MREFKVGETIFDKQCPSSKGEIIRAEHPDYKIKWKNGDIDWMSYESIGQLHKDNEGYTIKSCIKFLTEQGFSVTLTKV